MPLPLPHKNSITDGERSLFLAYLITAMFGLAFGLAVVLRHDSEAFFSRGMSFYQGWIMLSGALGVCFALRIARERLGRPGWRDPLVGMAIVTVVGAIIAGTFALPIYGTMFGPMTLMIIFFASPFTAVLWIATLVGVHFMLKTWHEERESIFGPRIPGRMPGFLNDLMTDLRIR